jgi:NAD(P)-dependent dehydrogenase (short-subunit alcohol dehydrogenase family)
VIDLTGKVGIVTGAADSQGQGAAVARTVTEQGAAVVLADIRGEEINARAAEIRSAGGNAAGVHADVSDEGDVKRIVETALEVYGRIDFLHSQAADLALLADPGDPIVTELTVANWRAQFETMVLGSMLCCKHAIPAMLASGGGSIVCTGSISGMMGEPNFTVYAAAKAALHQLVRSVSAQFGKQGIRCNGVAPGLILSAPGLALGEELITQYTRHCDTPYVGRPEDVAELVAFLVSDASRYITAEVIRIDGGFSQHSPMLAEQRERGLMVGSSA